MIFVIGSGPAGMASAVALVQKGHEVTMLDAGVELERDRARMVQQLENQDSADWDRDALARLKENMRSSTSGILLKYTYGSDFPYRETEKYIPREAENVAMVPSLAKGGFSNVWGAAVLPYLADDMSDWPISLNELVPHYQSILAFIGLAATRDDLATGDGGVAPYFQHSRDKGFAARISKSAHLIQARSMPRPSTHLFCC
jgi:choline dehydrogenase-like flavoprotein